ncbi:hypothetical protein RclHR1_10000002 [Rhizophagus clarus]|uniref:Protein kinase domain-containing protein n=1 Tax=Rhizophagus clarus TaxID=94130 RepID=A0A2Z6QC82_9GLOM|nr:hypothetical protein RclHR1_10000002 [Rhizophagus clarus]
MNESKKALAQYLKLNCRLRYKNGHFIPLEQIADGELELEKYTEQIFIYEPIKSKSAWDLFAEKFAIRNDDNSLEFETVKDKIPLGVKILIPVLRVNYFGEPFTTDESSIDKENYQGFLSREVLVGGFLIIRNVLTDNSLEFDRLKAHISWAINEARWKCKNLLKSAIMHSTLKDIEDSDGNPIPDMETLAKYLNQLYKFETATVISYEKVVPEQKMNESPFVTRLVPGITNCHREIKMERWVQDNIHLNLPFWIKEYYLNHGMVITSYGLVPGIKPVLDFLSVPSIKPKKKIRLKMSTTRKEFLHSKIYIDNFDDIEGILSFLPLYDTASTNVIQCYIFHEEVVIAIWEKEKQLSKPSQRLVEEINNALENINPYKSLTKVFSEYGHVICTEITMGERLGLGTSTVSKQVQERFCQYLERKEQLEWSELSDTIISKCEHLLKEFNMNDQNFIAYNNFDENLNELNNKNLKIKISTWMNNISGKPNSWSLTDQPKLIPLYEIVDDCEVKRQIQNLLENKQKILMTGVTQFSSSKTRYYRVEFENYLLTSDDYQVIGSVIVDNKKLDYLSVKFQMKSISGFSIIIEEFKKLDKEINGDLKVVWQLIGEPKSVGYFSKHTRNVEVFNTMLEIKISGQKISHQIDMEEELSPGFIIAASIQHPPTNYEHILQVVVKSWFGKTINFDIINHSLDAVSQKNNEGIEIDNNVKGMTYCNISVLFYTINPNKQESIAADFGGGEVSWKLIGHELNSSTNILSDDLLSNKVNSLVTLPIHYKSGKGTVKNLGKTFPWYQKAAENDDEKAMNKIIAGNENKNENNSSSMPPIMLTLPEITEEPLDKNDDNLSNKEDGKIPLDRTGNVAIAGKAALKIFTTSLAAAKPFLPWIESIITIINEILNQYETVEYNKKTCLVLVERVKMINLPVKTLVRCKENIEKFKSEDYYHSFIKLEKVLKLIKEFIEDISELNSYRKFILASDVKSKANQLLTKLEDCCNSLQFVIVKSQEARKQEQQYLDEDVAQMTKLLKSIDAEGKETTRTVNRIYEEVTVSSQIITDLAGDVEEMNSNKQTIFSAPKIDPKELYDTEESVSETSTNNSSVVKKLLRNVIPVACKTLNILDNSPQEAARIKAELSILNSIQSSNKIIKFHGQSEINGHPVLIFDWAEHGNLKDLYEKITLTWVEKLKIAHDIASGLVFLQACNVYHHDIRCENILITGDIRSGPYKAKIAKFRQSREHHERSIQIRTYGTIIRWLAPEKMPKDQTPSEERYTFKCEIFSYGMLLWELGAQKFPYKKMEMKEIMDHVKNKKRETFEDFNNTLLTNGLRPSESIAKAWAHEAKQRPTINNIYQELDSLMEINSSRRRYSNQSLQSISDDLNNIIIPEDDDEDLTTLETILTLDEGIAAHRNGKKDIAWKCFEIHATLGDPLAIYWKAYYYLKGYYTTPHTQNTNEAIKHFKLAADANVPEAQYYYANALEKAKKDGFLQYFTKAADNDNVLAQRELGRIYYYGLNGIERNKEKGIQYLRLAALKNNTNAINDLKQILSPDDKEIS